MAIYKRQNSKNYYSQFMLNGKTYIRSTQTSDRKLAQQFDKQYYNQIYEQEILGYKQAITLKDAIENYLAAKRGTSFEKSIPTIRPLLNKVVSEKTFVHEIETSDIHRLVLNLRKSDRAESTIEQYLQLIRAVINSADQHGFRVPKLIYPKTYRVKRRLRFLTKEEEQDLLAELSPNSNRRGMGGLNAQHVYDSQHFVVALLDTGCRYNEMAQMPWSAVDFEKNHIRIYRHKTRTESIIRLTNRFRYILLERYDDNPQRKWVFENKSQQHRDYRCNSFKRACLRAGLNTPERIRETGDRITFHSLRKTFASRLALAGVSLLKISKLLGHSSIRSTECYAFLTMETVSQEAVNILNEITPPGVNYRDFLEF